MKIIIILGLGAALTGCATQKNIPLTSDFWFKREKTIAVVSLPVPKAQQHIAGQQGMMDVVAGLVYGVAQSTLGKRLETMDQQPLTLLKEQLSQRLHQQGFTVKKINHIPSLAITERKAGFSRYNVSTSPVLAATDYVLIVQTPSWGIVRPYYGFIPLTAPQAHTHLVGELIDTRNNRLVWYYDSETVRSISGEWDQTPHFPNMVATIEGTVEDAKTRLEREFFRAATLRSELARYSIGQ